MEKSIENGTVFVNYKSERIKRNVKQNICTEVKCALNQRNLNWSDTFCVMQKRQTTYGCFNILDYSTVCFDLSRLDKHGSSYQE